MEERYIRPGWFTTHVFNRAVAALTRLGISVAGSRVLEVRGRSSGEWRRTPVNLLSLEGQRFLVAPRGNTQWVKNLRARGEGRLLVGRRIEPFAATELSDLTHEFSRSWIEARDGQPLDIYIDMIPDDEFERHEREIDTVHRELLAALK